MNCSEPLLLAAPWQPDDKNGFYALLCSQWHVWSEMKKEKIKKSIVTKNKY